MCIYQLVVYVHEYREIFAESELSGGPRTGPTGNYKLLDMNDRS